MTIAQQLKIKDFPFVIKDKDGNEIYWETSDGYWIKYEYDVNGIEIYWENSDGILIDKRPKIVEVSLEDIAAKLGINVAQLRIKE
jgi:uncharacterized protein YbcV (DUF1398 family)